MSEIDSDAYVIEYTAARGDDALFWGPDRRGYTPDLGRAGRYTREQAEAQERERAEDRAHRLSDVLRLARQTVDRDALRAARRPR